MRVREALGYSTSTSFIDPQQVDRLPASELTFALRSALSQCARLGGTAADVHFEGAYVLQRAPHAPAVPVVYVVRTAREDTAGEIHRFVWNQNQSPFLIVESPSTVRVYPGFAFQRESDQPLVSVASGVADALERLASFRAEAINDGSIWTAWAHAVDPLKRVDETLLRDLRSLDKRLQQAGVGRNTSHGLIGKYVYLRYLRDRDILSTKKLVKWEIDHDELFSGQATLEAFRRVNDELQRWLNGSVFSLAETELTDISQGQLQLVASVFSGSSPIGLDALQPSLFDTYDFSQIPIETLSSVYEQFLHDAQETGESSRGKTLGAYYTPLPLADYLLSELERRRPLAPPMKVLDPACGSGAFLVQCYRRLVEKQRRVLGRDLKKTELRDLLTNQLFGIDRDDDACRIAELSLILTLLDYVKPPDLEDTTFKLPCLRGRNVFGPSENMDGSRVEADFFDASGQVHKFLSTQRFDWIVGNPPWAEVKGEPAAGHDHYMAHQWMLAHKKDRPTSGNQIAEAFLWKAGDHLSAEGVCGLIVPAMTWFKSEATEFRRRFFNQRQVWCLANFANLVYVLFAGRVERPASAVFFDAQRPDGEHVIQSFAPFVAEQVANRPERVNKKLITWNIVASGGDLREIPSRQAAAGDSLTWKLAMWGTSRDRKLLERLGTRFKEDDFKSLERLGIGKPHEGVQLRQRPRKGAHETQATPDDSGESTEEIIGHRPELVGKARLLFDELRNVGRIFSFPPRAIGEISEDMCYVRVRGGLAGLDVSEPPHVVVDAARRFAVFSGEFLLVPPRQIGIAGTAGSEQELRALSLYLGSDFALYHQFFHSPQWGIDAVRADLDTLKLLPMPIGRLSSSELREWAELQQELASICGREFEARPRMTDSERRRQLLSELNERVFKLLGVRSTERWLVEDFVRVDLELNKGKVTREAMRKPEQHEKQQYLETLRDILDGFLSHDRLLRHNIEMLEDRQSALFSIGLVRSDRPVAPRIYTANDLASADFSRIRESLLQQHSQWVYFDRQLKIYDRARGTLYQFKPLQNLHWTRRQAVLDADDIIAETLLEGAGA